MRNEDIHPSDQDLLQLADGELPTRRSAQIREHLAACWNCRTRMDEIEETVGEFVRLHHQSLDPQLPSVAGPRALLKARLTELAHGARPHGWPGLRFELNERSFALVCALALFAAVGASVLYWQTVKSDAGVSADASPLPNPVFTPGATASVAITDICSMHHDVVVRPVPSTLQQSVFREYGMREPAAADYEIDFLISPGLGGAEDIRNLWPEPRYNTVWNSFVKDQLEDYLHRSVCSGKLSLAIAQQDIAGNWVAAYRKYFHSDRPLTKDSTLGASKGPSPLASHRNLSPAGFFVDRSYIAYLPEEKTGIAIGRPAPF